MPITAFPKDIEVRKLTAAQAKAIEKYVKSSGDKSLGRTALLIGIPTAAFLAVAGGTAFLVWHWLKDKELPSWKDVQVAAGGAVADIITDVGGAAARAAGFEDDPTTPEMYTLPSGNVVQLTRCQRWEYDAQDILEIVQAGGLSKTETVQAVTALLRVAKRMKAEGCDRPLSISKAQWDQA